MRIFVRKPPREGFETTLESFLSGFMDTTRMGWDLHCVTVAVIYLAEQAKLTGPQIAELAYRLEEVREKADRLFVATRWEVTVLDYPTVLK